MDVTETVRTLYPRLIEGDIGVLSCFCEKATVDSPLGDKQLPPEFVAETRAWLARHAARVEDVRTMASRTRVIHELTLWLDVDGSQRELPVMLIADITGDDPVVSCIRDLRIYHSTWPLTGSHQLRHEVLSRYDLAERPAEPVGTYHDALAEADAQAADAVYAPEGSVQEPAGSAYRHSGADRTEWYEQILADGPIVLHLGTLTDDGETVVYEYMVDRWGRDAIPHQSGAAAYTRGADGRLVSARIYDDVTPPKSIAGE